MSDLITQKIEALFASLSQPVYLLNRQGSCLVPRQPDTFILPASLQEDVPVSKSGYLFFRLPGFEVQVLATKDRPGAADLLRLLARLIANFHHQEGITGELGNALTRLLEGQLGSLEMDILVTDHGIPLMLDRSLLLLRLQKPLPEDALLEFIPREAPDLLIALNPRTLALARKCSPDGEEDLQEYAMALQDTLENELGLQSLIGIGETAKSLQELPQAYQQARQAIEIGRIFRPKQQIFSYRKLLMERFLMDCAPKAVDTYLRTLFHPGTAKLFTEEMLETVNVFLAMDLNLTDAARELYIHRNTLVYRLDKIQKALGLDLRHFQDAMLFKLLNDLRQRQSALGMQDENN